MVRRGLLLFPVAREQAGKLALEAEPAWVCSVAPELPKALLANYPALSFGQKALPSAKHSPRAK
jgi:hypothetical protein